MVNTHVVNKSWISQLNEPPLEPDLPIIDPHHHFWVRPDPEQTYVLDDLILDIGGHVSYTHLTLPTTANGYT